MTNQPHAFDGAINVALRGDGRWRGNTQDACGNMVGHFRGTTAVAALAAVLAYPARQGEPIH